MKRLTSFDSDIADWVKRYLSGESMYQIGKDFGCCTSLVRYRLLVAGVTLRTSVVRKVIKRTKACNAKSVEERYNRFVIRQDGCWGWSGSKKPKGYGVLWVDGTSIGAHRVSYTLHKGDPGSFYVCHSCDNPECTNPDHLFLGTQSDNIQDAVKKGRRPKRYKKS